MNHQHIGTNGKPCGASHPISEKHGNNVTIATHNYTIIHMSDCNREKKLRLLQKQIIQIIQIFVNPYYRQRRQRCKRALRIIRRRNCRLLAA